MCPSKRNGAVGCLLQQQQKSLPIVNPGFKHMYSADVMIGAVSMLCCLVFFHYDAGPANTYNENETIAKYEIMDGAPVRGGSYVLCLYP